jgi:ribose 5-phosphate isomerase A
MDLKQEAAHQALGLVQSGMILGLGSGSTTAYFIDLLGKQIKSGSLKDILAVPTSEQTAVRALSLGIPLTSLGSLTRHQPTTPLLDMVVDGADEVDPQLNLIKGLGRALLREKIVEIHTENFVVIVDETKLVPCLGSKVPLPVEILPFEAEVHVEWLNTLGCKAEIWREADGSLVVTDNGNNLALCHFKKGIADPEGLARALSDRPGIIEHGLFLKMTRQVIVAGQDGVRFLR